jgi:hypothetical protein
MNGASLPEALIVLALAGLVSAIALPVTAASVDAGRAWEAASFVTSKLRLARQQAAVRTSSVGLVFDDVAGRWMIRVCVDGNRNGLRRAEILDGTDRCPEGPFELESLFPGAHVAVDGSLRGPDGEPGSSEAVRFGRSDIASFSPGGSCTAGSLFVRSAKGVQYAVRVAGVTGRTRILRYDPGTSVWRDV